MKKVKYDLLEVNEDYKTLHENEPFTGTAYELYGDGKPRSEVEFIDGVENGQEKEWYKNGQLKMQSVLKNAVLHGEKREWFENGQLKSESIGEFGIITSNKEWNEEGNLIEEYHLAKSHPQYESLKISRRNAAPAGVKI